MKKTFIYLIFLVLFFNIVIAQGEIYDNGTVYINDSHGYLSAYPELKTNSGYVYNNLISHKFGGDVIIAYGFNSTDALPKSIEKKETYTENITTEYNHNLYNVTFIGTTTSNCEIGNGSIKRFVQYSNGSSVVCFDRYVNNNSDYRIFWTVTSEVIKHYRTIQDSFTKVYRDLDGKDVWYYMILKDITVNKTYSSRFWLDIIQDEGKYDIVVYPKSYGSNIVQAYLEGNMLLLDPTFNLSNIVSYYKFDGDATDSANSNDGTVTGATNDFIYGKINEGYNFDGSGNDKITTSLYMQSVPTSICAWIRPNNIINYNTIVSFGGYGSSSKGIFFASDNQGDIILYFGDGSGLDGHEYHYGLVSNSWYFICMTWNGTEDTNGFQIYVNGSFYVQGTTTRSWAGDSSLPLEIGNYGNGLSNSNMNIDEVSIWNIVLSQTQITALFNNGTGLQYPFSDSDTCTYSGSGDWLIEASDNCILSTDTSLPSNQILITGTGLVTITADIGASLVHIGEGSTVYIPTSNGGSLYTI